MGSINETNQLLYCLCVSHAKQSKKYSNNNIRYPEFKSNCTAERCTSWFGKHDQCIAAAAMCHIWRQDTADDLQGPGLRVRGAGTQEANGWYSKKEIAEGPPAIELSSRKNWRELTEGRPWYEKGDGCCIYWDGEKWFCVSAQGSYLYMSPTPQSVRQARLSQKMINAFGKGIVPAK